MPSRRRATSTGDDVRPGTRPEPSDDRGADVLVLPRSYSEVAYQRRIRDEDNADSSGFVYGRPDNATLREAEAFPGWLQTLLGWILPLVVMMVLWNVMARRAVARLDTWSYGVV